MLDVTGTLAWFDFEGATPDGLLEQKGKGVLDEVHIWPCRRTPCVRNINSSGCYPTALLEACCEFAVAKEPKTIALPESCSLSLSDFSTASIRWVVLMSSSTTFQRVLLMLMFSCNIKPHNRRTLKF